MGRVYTVSEITTQVRGLLEPRFRDVSVQGEISNCRPASSGHLYFSLKDQESLLAAVMFRSRASLLSFTPADGHLVVARGSLTVYAKRGVYQMVCESLALAGQGAILAMLEERKRRLSAEGLFDGARKRPLPLLPTRVAVVSSPTGAVIRDILRVTRRRNPGLDITLLPAPVQGEGAAEILARRIRQAGDFGLGQVVILARGGGSLEDLLPFYDETLIRAIAASSIPVISAVGHETDFTFADLAADVRAPTPSAAAEIVCAARAELVRRVTETRIAMERNVVARLGRARLQIRQYSAEEIERFLTSYTEHYMLRLQDARDTVANGMGDTLMRFRHRLDLARTEVSLRSPHEILRRGYAVVRRAGSRHVIRSAAEIGPSEHIDVSLSRGRLTAEVLESHGENGEI